MQCSGGGGLVERDQRLLKENGLLFNADGDQIETEAPLQVFTRWYGFSLTFPSTEIYGET